MLSAGSKAPVFSLLDLNGSPRSLAEILSRGPVLLVFYKISCPTCQFTLPFLERIAKGSLPIVTISQDDDARYPPLPVEIRHPVHPARQ